MIEDLEIYVVCRKLREKARLNPGEIWRWKRKEFEKHRNIEHFFAVTNSRIIVSGEVTKKKRGSTESKRFGKREVPYPLFMKTRLSVGCLASKKRISEHFGFRNALLLLKNV